MRVTRQLGTLIDAVADDAAEADRTAIVQVFGFDSNSGHHRNGDRLRWTAILDYAAVTRVDIDAYVSVDGGTTYGLVQSQTLSSGTATLNDYQQQKASGAGGLSIDGFIDVKGATHAKIVLTPQGGAGGDTLSLIASLTEEK